MKTTLFSLTIVQGVNLGRKVSQEKISRVLGAALEVGNTG